MAFYIPLGPRGLLFRLGLVIIKVVGGVVYWRACRRRALMPLPMPEPVYVTER